MLLFYIIQVTPCSYCDCFAAGIYCADPCSCQGCFNRPEYEDTVLETRQQIESRNPLAFAPKIVQHAIELPADSTRVWSTIDLILTDFVGNCG